MNKKNNKDWINVFKEDTKNKLDYGDKEYKMYKRTGDLIYLQQAGNKLFSAVENYLMIKYKKRVRSYQSLLKQIEKDKTDRELLTQTVQLHYFFYNADLQMDRYTAEILYKDNARKLKMHI
jgi:hypothetical protein